jgi:endonuclease/exonuclease/phosphatase family metal-dependent hydrolase
MEFSVLFWNIWFENQLGGPGKSQKILVALDRLIKKYKPDIIGLNEVLKERDDASPFVTDFLRSLGYKYIHFTSSGPLSDKWDKGNALCSKYSFNATKEITLGRNISAERKGFFGYTNKALVADINLKDKKKIKLILVHPIYLNRHNFLEHYRQMRSLTALLKQSENLSGTIVGGDFNEPFYIPLSMKRNFYHMTGTFLNRTWRHKASKKTYIRLNVDRILWSKKDSLKLIDFKIIDDYTSDHKPLYGKFSF